MPKTKRDMIKRNLAQAYINIDWAGAYINEVYILFKDTHPELAELLKVSLEGIYNVQELLNLFTKHAYGKEDPDWTSWAATGRPRHK